MTNNKSRMDISVTPDLSEATAGEKRLYVEYLLKSRALTKDVLREAMYEVNLRGRSNIIGALPTQQGWSRSYNTKSSKDAIKKFCQNVPLEVLMKHIIAKEMHSLHAILKPGSTFHLSKNGSTNPLHIPFKINVELSNEMI